MRTAVRRLLPGQTVLFFALAAAVTLLTATQAAADEQRVSRFGIAIYGGVASLSPSFVNDAIDETNEQTELLLGLAPIEHIGAGPVFSLEGRFFISDALVAVLGAGTIRGNSSLDLLPQPETDVVVEGNVRAIPIHAGLNYYFLPYTRGDFTLRPFTGGGFMGSVDSRVKVGAGYVSPDTTIDAFQRAVGNGAGFYLEGGVHAMIPSRYSFILNIFYRNLKVRRLYAENSVGEIQGLLLDDDGNPAELDLSGLGIRLGVNINILNRF